jgi:hypothetical protein
MAENSTRYIDNIYFGGGPLNIPGKFQAGGTQAIKQGEMLELSSTNWIPLDADQAMSAIIAVAACDIKPGDLAGYYPIIVPRPGDRFVFALDSAGNSALGTALYWSDSETVTTSGNNALAYVSGWDNYPLQGHGSEDIVSDAGTTLTNKSNVILSFKLSVSYYAAIWA